MFDIASWNCCVLMVWYWFCLNSFVEFDVDRHIFFSFYIVTMTKSDVKLGDEIWVLVYFDVFQILF